MDTLLKLISELLIASPSVLALIVSLAGIGLAWFAIFAVHSATRHKDPH